VLIRANGLACLRVAVSVSVPALLLGGLSRFGSRDRRAAPDNSIAQLVVL